MNKAEVEAILRGPYTIELEYGETPEGGVAALVAEWPGCITAGDTREEALGRIGDAMRDWVEYRLAHGLEIPEPMKRYGGTVVVKMPKSLHRDVERRAEHEGVSMNQWIATTIARAIGSAGGSRVISTARRAAASGRFLSVPRRKVRYAARKGAARK